MRKTFSQNLQKPLTLAVLGILTLCSWAPSSLAHEPENTTGTQKSGAQTAACTPTVSEQRQGNKTFAVGSVVVNASAEKIWQILTDYHNAPDVFSNLQKCEVVEDKGANKLVRQSVHPKGTPVKLEYIVAIKETAPTLMEWHRQSGALKEVAGSWRLEPNQETGTTKVTYSIYIDGGLLLPAWLLRGQSKNYLPELLLSLKQVSEKESTPLGTAHTSQSMQPNGSKRS